MVNLQRPVHLLLDVPPFCHFKLAWMLLCLTICACVRGLLQSLQWCSSVGCNGQFLHWRSSVGLFQLSFFSSGVPVYPAVFAWSPNGIPVYTGSTSGIPVAFQCTLDQPVYTGSGYGLNRMPLVWKVLTHWGRYKMAGIFQTTFSDQFSWIKISIKIAPTFVPKRPINNIPSLVQIIACHRPGNYLKHRWSVCWRIYASLGLNELTEQCIDWHSVHISGGYLRGSFFPDGFIVFSCIIISNISF